MGTDDAIIVQFNSSGLLVGQYGSMSSDTLPDPDAIDIAYDNIVDFVNAYYYRSTLTEYGFQYFFSPRTISPTFDMEIPT